MLGEKLKNLRNERGLTQKQLAVKLNVANGTIAMWETNKRTPDLKSIKTLSEFFGVTTDYLIGKSSDRIHYEELADIYHRAIITWSESHLFSDEDVTQIKMHYSELLLRYKELVVALEQCKGSDVQRLMLSSDDFDDIGNNDAIPLSRQKKIEQYLIHKLSKPLSDLKAWIGSAPHYFSLSFDRNLALEDMKNADFLCYEKVDKET